MKAMDRGQYEECVRCGKDINEKRLGAMPWATLCIRCQEETEAEHTSSRMVLTGFEAKETTSLVGVCGCSINLRSLRSVSTHFVIPAGTVLKVTLIDALSTDVSMPGDYF